MDEKFDVVIIGGGPAGLTAGLYSARSKLKSLLIERGIPGGKIVEAAWVDNYPGFPDRISGHELTHMMLKQATKYGLEILNASVTAIDIEGTEKKITTDRGDIFAKAIIITGGSERQQLDVPGEKEYTGRGVSYCATCDGPFFQDKAVAVIGGGNTSVTLPSSPPG